MKEISSTQNPLIKEIVELKSKASKRREMGLCIIEGKKEIEIALSAGIEIIKILTENTILEIPDTFKEKIKEHYSVTSTVMDKIALRDVKQSFVAIAKTNFLSLNDISLSAPSFILILENIEKPGNLGSLLRTADAANVDAVICTDMKTDIYNPNVIRNSLGCVFSKPIVVCSNDEVLQYCQKHNIKVHASYLHRENYYYSEDFTLSTAIVFGTESTGISDFWITHSDTLIKIPMMGKIDSMNVSNSASILLYEVVRQRQNFKA